MDAFEETFQSFIPTSIVYMWNFNLNLTPNLALQLEVEFGAKMNNASQSFSIHHSATQFRGLFLFQIVLLSGWTTDVQKQFSHQS